MRQSILVLLGDSELLFKWEQKLAVSHDESWNTINFIITEGGIMEEVWPLEVVSRCFDLLFWSPDRTHLMVFLSLRLQQRCFELHAKTSMLTDHFSICSGAFAQNYSKVKSHKGLCFV